MASRRLMPPTVLVIEPYADLRSEIAAALRREHYVCEAVGNTAEAMLKLRGGQFSYVVLDEDVGDLGKLVAAIDPASELLMLSESEGPGWPGHSSLRKPFGRAELVARLELLGQ